MRKGLLSEKIQQMLKELQKEVESGGYNEYSQFCEENFYKIIPYLPARILLEIANNIEENSVFGIKLDS